MSELGVAIGLSILTTLASAVLAFHIVAVHVN